LAGFLWLPFSFDISPAFINR